MQEEKTTVVGNSRIHLERNKSIVAGNVEVAKRSVTRDDIVVIVAISDPTPGAERPTALGSEARYTDAPEP
jgi:hypothetical protein